MGGRCNLNYNLGIYAQDRWTLNRLTLGGGIRLDMQNESTEPFTAGPHKWAPNRNTALRGGRERAELEGHRSARSAAYDLFGNGKTAIKASVSRGVEQDSIRYAQANNPASTISTQTARAWTDTNRNFVPDCNLTIGALNGECGPWQTTTFGTAVPGTVYSPAHHAGVGRAALQLGVFHQRAAADCAPNLRDRRLLPSYRRELQRRSTTKRSARTTSRSSR